jgi:putative pyruvate formate lyase activating enzyme
MTAYDAYRCCRLCPRQCQIDRSAGRHGVCKESDTCRVADMCAHFGEEPVFSGTRGSGTVFFSGCSCRCFFCQNYQISLQGGGRIHSDDQLLSRVLKLVEKGVHNINFVTPDHFWPHVRRLCRRLRRRGVELPFIYNCSGYQQPDLIDQLAETIDIFLPDFKFADPELARQCMGDSRYPEIAQSAIANMLAAKGALTPWDDSGQVTARQGVLVRHLVLPGQVENSLAALDCLAMLGGADLALSVMSQFRPTPGCRQQGMLMRAVRSAEYDRVCQYVTDIGFARVFIQPDAGDPDYLPDFDREHDVFAGNRRPD